jgi:hypothetical protein
MDYRKIHKALYYLNVAFSAVLFLGIFWPFYASRNSDMTAAEYARGVLLLAFDLDTFITVFIPCLALFFPMLYKGLAVQVLRYSQLAVAIAMAFVYECHLAPITYTSLPGLFIAFFLFGVAINTFLWSRFFLVIALSAIPVSISLFLTASFFLSGGFKGMFIEAWNLLVFVGTDAAVPLALPLLFALIFILYRKTYGRRPKVFMPECEGCKRRFLDSCYDAECMKEKGIASY